MDDASTVSADEARKIKEEAEAEANIQMDALKKMENKQKKEMVQSSGLSHQLAMLKEEIATARVEQKAVNLGKAQVNVQLNLL